ncbi:MAG: hypothetical protein H6721_21990 [Sandaracinus sp.]|nr:hypothetical protein [Sandaracinus sp.]
MSLCACEPEPLPVELEAQIVRDGDSRMVRVAVQTAPGAEVTVTRGDFSETATADAEGKVEVVSGYGLAAPDAPVRALVRLEDRTGEASVTSLTTQMTLESDGRLTTCWPEGCRIAYNLRDGWFTGDGRLVLRADGQEFVSQTGARTRFSLNLLPTVDSLGVARVLDGSDETPPLRAEVAGVEVQTTRGVARGGVLVGYEALRAAVEARFASEGDRVAPHDEVTGSALVVAPMREELGLRHLGAPTRLTDVRFVANVQTRMREGGSCGRYREEGGRRVEVRRRARDLEIRLFDLRDGSVAAEHVIEGPQGSCAAINFGTLSFGDLPYERAATWIRSEHARLAAP